MKKQIRYSPEMRERAVRLVYDHQGEYESQWAAMVSIAAKIGCTPDSAYLGAPVRSRSGYSRRSVNIGSGKTQGIGA